MQIAICLSHFNNSNDYMSIKICVLFNDGIIHSVSIIIVKYRHIPALVTEREQKVIHIKHVILFKFYSEKICYKGQGWANELTQ